MKSPWPLAYEFINPLFKFSIFTKALLGLGVTEEELVVREKARYSISS